MRGGSICQPYLNAVGLSHDALASLLLSLTGLRGLTSVIGWRMEAHYKISDLCLSIRVTERGLAAVPCQRAFNMSTEKNRVLRFRQRRWGKKQKPAETLLKHFICNVLTLVAHQGFPLSHAGLLFCTDLQFLTSVDKHSLRVSFTNE